MSLVTGGSEVRRRLLLESRALPPLGSGQAWEPRQPRLKNNNNITKKKHMQHSSQLRLAMTFASLALGLACDVPVARADAVVDWNIIAAQTIGAGARLGGSAGLDFAMVHTAIYDAVEATDGRFEPYYVVIQGASGSPVAATAKAAHDVLVNRFPAQAASVDTAYHAYLTSHGLAETDPGVLVGQAAAAGIIALRAHDGSYPAVPEVFVGGTQPGDWRPTPPALAPMAAPWLGSVTPFTLNSPTQFRAPPPPRLEPSVRPGL